MGVIVQQHVASRGVIGRIEPRLAVVGANDQAVPGDLDTRGEEALGVGVTRLVREVNQEGATRPHELNNFNGF